MAELLLFMTLATDLSSVSSWVCIYLLSGVPQETKASICISVYSIDIFNYILYLFNTPLQSSVIVEVRTCSEISINLCKFQKSSQTLDKHNDTK